MNNLSENEGMKSMMKSIFCYGSLERDNSYLDSYRKNLSENVFNSVFDNYKKYLSDTFTVRTGVYEDYEGCTYNELVKK